jgi:hypothetical protein
MTDGSDWPVELAGVTESLVATQGPDGAWNLAPLGIFAPGFDDALESPAEPRDGPVDDDRNVGGTSESVATARTWGRTRTRNNFERRGEGVIQFVRDPLLFVDCALGIVEREDSVLEAADAWVRVDVAPLARGTSDGTEWRAWALDPTESTVERTVVATTRRGYNAVLEASVWASRLEADGYERSELETRLAFLGEVVDAAGSDRDRRAFDRIAALTGWQP